MRAHALCLATTALLACAEEAPLVDAPDATSAFDATTLDAPDARADDGAAPDGSPPNDRPPTPDDLGASCASDATCPAGTLCVSGRCARAAGVCASGDDCADDARCVASQGRCVAFARGESNASCTREVRPGVFSPAVQCRFDAAPAGDPYPEHLHVLSTPMVVDLRVYRASPDAPSRPSIVAVFDDGEDGGVELPTGVVRILDGRTCALQATLTDQLVSHSSPPAVADLDGDGTPEIVAFKAGGGLVAFRYGAAPDDAGVTRGAWRVMWRSTRAGAAFDPTGGGWTGPTVADLDDDGRPEVIRQGMVFDGQTGAYVGGDQAREALASYAGNTGAFSVIQDADEDGIPELVTATRVFAWNASARAWAPESWHARSGCAGDGCGEGQVAVADLGDWTSERFRDPRLPEVAVVSAGWVRIDTLDGRTVFGPVALPGGGTGGPPTVADFDGDGRAEIATAGARAYSVIDPDCGIPSAARGGGRCETGATGGVLWSRPSQDMSSNMTGSTSFDFEGDGRVEAVYADECFARVYDGRTGAVLFSQHHSSCTWFENPVVADVDGDLRAEVVVGSNFNCGSSETGIACPGVGPRNVDTLFAGLRCQTGADCPSGRCVEGLCRCEADAECCAPMPGAGASVECTYVCAAPPEGTAGAGNTCRASRPRGVRGLRVYSDVADRWVGSRPLWNQHTYNVTNVRDDGAVPRASAVQPNWRQRGLNNFRTNTQGDVERTASPDATAAVARVECGTAGASVTARVCNRGTAPLGDGLPVGVYDGDPAAGANRICTAATPRALAPGECVELPCAWPRVPTASPGATVHVRADDTATRRECFEQNNLARQAGVFCRPPE